LIGEEENPAARSFFSRRSAFLKRVYKTPAVSGRGFTATVRLCGRINAKPTRKIPYAVKTPNAIEPNVAQTNIAKFNTSAMILFSVYFTKHASNILRCSVSAVTAQT
jgi:hypothetical protein